MSSQSFLLQGNVSDLDGEDQPNEPQGFDGIMPLQEAYDYVTNEQSDGKFTSTTFCLATVESCSVVGGDTSLQTSTYRIEAEGSKIRFEEEVETEVSQEGKYPMVGEFHLELDGGSDLKHNEVATVLTKRSNNIKKQDNSLVIHPPNVVPFSDEWLATIEAAGEEDDGTTLSEQLSLFVAEQSKMKIYVEQVSQLLATKKNLRLQLTADGEKFLQFQFTSSYLQRLMLQPGAIGTPPT
ncbi:hypothetical protein L6452_41040 [Arctium lappa]|uniref:Uncharacterized protein n=1 Tax=Arctium lappa TaxID=4217 RepID=A0ACB8XMR0_ARCLA|nr:hypothetical protein L6452_41040 [Arctium lappa]